MKRRRLRLVLRSLNDTGMHHHAMWTLEDAETGEPIDGVTRVIIDTSPGGSDDVVMAKFELCAFDVEDRRVQPGNREEPVDGV